MPAGQLFFGFSGRINRGKFWLAVLVFFIVSVVLSLVVTSIAATRYAALYPGNIPYYFSSLGAVGIIAAIIGIGMFVSQLAVAVKRLHDRNKSGWWVLFFFVLPSLLSGIANGYVAPDGGYYDAGSSTIALVCAIGALMIYLWALVELGFLRGTIGPNRFGSDPLETVIARPYPGQAFQPDDRPPLQ